MMKEKFTKKSIELLSAYIDGEVTPTEKSTVESLLKGNEEYHRLFSELLKNKELTSSLPVLKPRKSFVVLPDMVGIKPSRRVYPIFRLATVIATILFVFVMVGDQYLYPGATKQMDSQTFTKNGLEVMPVEEKEALITRESEVQEQEPALEMAVSDQETPQAGGLEILPKENGLSSTELPVSQGEGEVIPAPMVTLESEKAQRTEGTPLALEIAEQEIARDELEPDSEKIADEIAKLQAEQYQRKMLVIRGIQVILASTAVITGLLALYFRRRGI